MALLDAIALSEALNRYPIPEALLRYAAQRRRHVRFYQMISNLFTPFYQSRNSVLPMIRNNVFHPASQIWPLNRGLTQLVSGSLVSTGI
jgi:2-polyprenyl-6-methoxyphenol hydroxylase-like FAD-dependent oxidoreductase